MKRVIGNALRPLVVVWLLLTLPVVCHHETAIAVVSAVAVRDGHPHAAAGAGGHHGLAPAHTAPSAGGRASHAAADPAVHPASEWCAGHATTGLHALLEGQQGISLLAPAGVPAPDAPRTAGGPLQPAALEPPPHPPPAPPPRLLA